MKFKASEWALLLLCLAGAGFAGGSIRRELIGSVSPLAETDPVPHDGDAADDPSVWVHPEDPSRSVIFATDKLGGIVSYDLGGEKIKYYPVGEVVNIDVRYGLKLGNDSVDYVAVTNRSDDTLGIYLVDPKTRLLTANPSGAIELGSEPYGLCAYRSPRSGKHFVFITGREGEVEQWELLGDGGGVAARRARKFKTGGKSEGCVADDDRGVLFIAEEERGIWRFGAEPSDGKNGTLIDDVEGHLEADVEGLAIYRGRDGKGYLVASSQGDSSFAVYERAGENRYVMQFTVDSHEDLDGISKTDGIELVSFGLGKRFPNGLFVAQDNKNKEEGERVHQNFKLVSWADIAKSTSARLLIDTTVDPRQ